MGKLIDGGRSYEKELLLQDYAGGPEGKLKLGYLLREFQQLSGEHLLALNIPYQELLRRKQVFLLNKLKVKISKIPIAMERIKLVTTPKTPIGAQFIRTNLVLDEGGSTIISADSTWLLVDPETRKILRPKEFSSPLIFTEDEKPTTLPKFKAERPEALEELGRRVVSFSDLDVNVHMNNATYADIVCDFLPYEEIMSRDVAEFYINFQSEARLGEEIKIWRGRCQDGSWYMEGLKAQGGCFEATIKLKD